MKKIPGNVPEDSRECSQRFWGMIEKIPGNVRKDSGECSRRFRGMFEGITENLNLDLFCEILLTFYQILQLNREKMPLLHIGTLPKISFKNLTPGLYTSTYGNYKIRSIKHTQSLRLIKRSSH